MRSLLGQSVLNTHLCNSIQHSASVTFSSTVKSCIFVEDKSLLKFMDMKKIFAILVLLAAIYIGYQFVDRFDPGNFTLTDTPKLILCTNY